MPPPPALVVLVIHDDLSVLAALGQALHTPETHPVLATTTDAAAKLRGGFQPDVVVVDLDGRDGGAMLARAMCLLSDLVPVVALSSRPRLLLETGMAEAVVMKPFEPAHLGACVRSVCERPRGAV